MELYHLLRMEVEVLLKVAIAINHKEDFEANERWVNDVLKDIIEIHHSTTFSSLATMDAEMKLCHEAVIPSTRNFHHCFFLDWQHAFQLRWIGGAGHIHINVTQYQLNNIHWHTPTEHTIKGQRLMNCGTFNSYWFLASFFLQTQRYDVEKGLLDSCHNVHRFFLAFAKVAEENEVLQLEPVQRQCMPGFLGPASYHRSFYYSACSGIIPPAWTCYTEDVSSLYIDLGDPNWTCEYCNARFSYGERLKRNGAHSKPKYHCYYGGGRPQRSHVGCLDDNSKNSLDHFRDYGLSAATSSTQAKNTDKAKVEDVDIEEGELLKKDNEQEE
ncbi:alpha carbonic anhydrase 7 [Artemisia annua]|uniref:Alpha carbonic anhydrase 7 n=1 Tax=Artemisia annua TaxID=35608 RepID=A0A2U1QGF8_ARTAN|nr:alpha carbonic anhydrase 7 [Artemisia annua]